MTEIRAQAGAQIQAMVQGQRAGVIAKSTPVDTAAKEFESQFVSQMLGYMFEGIKTNDLFGGGESEDVYRSFMIDEYGKVITNAGGIGVADYIKRQLLATQEVSHAPTT